MLMMEKAEACLNYRRIIMAKQNCSASFKADPDILKAAELINNREEYEALLMPEK
jgi:hypothetical protein